MISKHLSGCRGNKILEVYIVLPILITDIANKIWHHGLRVAAPKKQLNRRMPRLTYLRLFVQKKLDIYRYFGKFKFQELLKEVITRIQYFIIFHWYFSYDLSLKIGSPQDSNSKGKHAHMLQKPNIQHHSFSF